VETIVKPCEIERSPRAHNKKSRQCDNRCSQLEPLMSTVEQQLNCIDV
jgi:hypothetical protein